MKIIIFNNLDILKWIEIESFCQKLKKKKKIKQNNIQ